MFAFVFFFCSQVGGTFCLMNISDNDNNAINNEDDDDDNDNNNNNI